jgi:hypothetical protein
MPNYFTYRANVKGYDSGFVVTPSGSAVGALQDSLDSSFIRKPATNDGHLIEFQYTDPSPAQPAAGTYLIGLLPRIRMAQGSGGYTSLYIGYDSGFAGDVVSGTVTLPATITTVSTASRAATGIITVTTAAAHTVSVGDLILIQGSTTGTPALFVNNSYRVLTTPTATTFTAQDIRGAQAASTVNATNGNISYATNYDNYGFPYWVYVTGTTTACTGTAAQNLVKGSMFSIDDSGTSASRATIYEAYVEVQTAALPTVVIDSVDNDASAPYVVTTTSRPTIAWTTSQADGFPQQQWRLKIFTAATATPDTTTTGLVYDSYVQYDNADAWNIETDLATGTTYYAYVKVSTASAPYNPDDGWSSWASLTFSTSFTPPTAPTCSVSYSTPLERVRATLTGAALSGAYASQTFDLQRSDDGGTTWYFVRGGTGVTPNGSFQTIEDDFEMKRGITARYRARSVGLTTTGSTIASAWGTVATVAIPASSVWVLRSLGTTGELALVKDVKVLADLEITQEESMGVFKPLGRSTTLVVHGELTGQDGTYSVLCPTQATFDALVAVINSQALVLVVDPFGEQKYIRVTGRSWTKTGATTAPRYEVQINYVATESGLTAG